MEINTYSPILMEEAKKIAREAGYHDMRQLKPWKGFEVLEPIYTDGIIRYEGYPQFLLVKDGKIRWTKDSEESLSIMENV